MKHCSACKSPMCGQFPVQGLEIDIYLFSSLTLFDLKYSSKLFAINTNLANNEVTEQIIKS